MNKELFVIKRTCLLLVVLRNLPPVIELQSFGLGVLDLLANLPAREILPEDDPTEARC